MKKKWQFALASVLLTSALVAPVADAAASYTVQKGDTLSKIAKAHNTTIQQLKRWNNLKSDHIFVEQKLIIASAGSKPPATNIVHNPISHNKQEGQVTNTVEVDTQTYKVQKGDTLTKVAKKYNVTVASIKEWNNLNSDSIFVGQILKFGKEEVEETNTNSPVDEVTESDNDVGGQFTEQEIISADTQIASQLAKETVLTYEPGGEGQAKYESVLALAQGLVGTPYMYGGNTVDGFDCSGFVKYVYANTGMPIIRKSSLNYFLQDTTIVQNPVPGDLVFFKNTYISNISHMGIYIGDNEFIHAGGAGVEVSNVTNPYWQDRFVAFKRFNSIQ
ncbi:LysM peptidoglycan-binding domain-containing protein [Solibacillus sp. CAU 1738]|uniref:C40 family peptidase n=1 Tax=Solibacillus sp. CAU 1738 TaxID=3140363 RepID=UPI003261702E